jgi:hypothetical protein
MTMDHNVHLPATLPHVTVDVPSVSVNVRVYDEVKKTVLGIPLPAFVIGGIVIAGIAIARRRRKCRV